MTSGFGTLFLRSASAKSGERRSGELFFAAIVAGSAYLSTPYLKIGERIYALSPDDREPDPPGEEMKKK